jgi:gluconokinase
MERPDRTLTVVVMGVSGTGKTTIGKALALQEGWAFAEGDQFHPAANVSKMRQGIPLDDDDRWPWLGAIADWIGENEAAGHSAVVACSALKRAYRDLLSSGHPSVWFAHLTAPDAELDRRLRNRPGHYMPASLLPSQLQTLQPLQPDEPGAAFDDAGGVEDVVARVRDAMPRPPADTSSAAAADPAEAADVAAATTPGDDRPARSTRTDPTEATS